MNSYVKNKILKLSHFFLLIPHLLLSMCTFRCLFEVQRFVSENNLMFVGATWYNATSDAYVAYIKKEQQGVPEEEACALIPGYDNPCPSGRATTAMIPSILLLGVSVMQVLNALYQEE